MGLKINLGDVGQLALAGVVAYVIMRGPEGVIVDLDSLFGAAIRGLGRAVGVPDTLDPAVIEKCCAAMKGYRSEPVRSTLLMAWYCPVQDWIAYSRSGARPAACSWSSGAGGATGEW